MAVAVSVDLTVAFIVAAGCEAAGLHLDRRNRLFAARERFMYCRKRVVQVNITRRSGRLSFNTTSLIHACLYGSDRKPDCRVREMVFWMTALRFNTCVIPSDPERLSRAACSIRPKSRASVGKISSSE